MSVRHVAVDHPPRETPREVRIAGAVPGDSWDTHNNSGTPAALFAALDRRKLLVSRLDVSVGFFRRYALGALTLRTSHQEWQRQFRQAIYQAQSRRCHQLLSKVQGPNLILQMFRGFQAQGLPYWLFLDTTDAIREAHGRPAPFGSGGLGEDVERKLYADATHIFVMASEPKRSLVEHYGIPESRVTVVGAGPNMLYPETLGALGDPVRYSQRVALFVGRHDFERKGGPELLEAFAKARAVVPGARLLMAGVQLPADPPGVTSLGEVTDRDRLQSLYEMASVFCMPSRFESMGVAAIEAMAYGLPVIGTKVGGIPESVRHEESGLLVDPRAADQLSEALIRLLQDPSLAMAMGRAGRELVDTYLNWDAVVDRMLGSTAGLLP